MHEIEDYKALCDGYSQGIYTRGEVVSKSLDLLYKSTNRQSFWLALLPEHRAQMTQLICDFNESDEPFAIKADPVRVWHEMSALKNWLSTKIPD